MSCKLPYDRTINQSNATLPFPLKLPQTLDVDIYIYVCVLLVKLNLVVWKNITIHKHYITNFCGFFFFFPLKIEFVEVEGSFSGPRLVMGLCIHLLHTPCRPERAYFLLEFRSYRTLICLPKLGVALLCNVLQLCSNCEIIWDSIIHWAFNLVLQIF